MKPSKLVIATLTFCFFASFCHSENWSTTDGKTYKNVVVNSHDSKVVTITSDDGIATFPIPHLNKDLQQRIVNDNVTARDWTTTDGKTYKNVKVDNYDDTSVTIIDDNGGAVIQLENLPPDLQKRFHFDPAKAQAELQKKEDEQKAAAIAQAAKESEEKYAEIKANTKTIREVETDQSNYVGKQFYVEGDISLDTYYNYGYGDLQTTYFSFKIEQGDHYAFAYMRKDDPIAIELRKSLLDMDKPLNAVFTVMIEPQRFDTQSSTLMVTLLDYFPRSSDQ